MSFYIECNGIKHELYYRIAEINSNVSEVHYVILINKNPILFYGLVNKLIKKIYKHFVSVFNDIDSSAAMDESLSAGVYNSV